MEEGHQQSGRKILATPSSIYVEETHESETVELESSRRSVSLASKLDDFVFKLGYTNAQVVAIAIQLLIDGKVRIHFRNYQERLELSDKRMRMDKASAFMMIEDYLKQQREEEIDPNAPAEAGATQKIIVQLPPHLRKGE